MRPLVFTAALVTGVLAFPVSDAAAQTTPAAHFASDARPGFLTNYRFHLNAARLAPGDEQFGWDADIGGDVDLIDYGTGRLNFLANYEVVMGSEFRAFDPNQGNYTLDLLGTVQVGDSTEIGLLFHHVSRHLSDRPKRFPVDWNMIGIQAFHRRRVRQLDVDSNIRLLAATNRSSTDYRLQLKGGASVQHGLRVGVDAVVSGDFIVIGVTEDTFDRGTLGGGRLEGALRFTRPGATLDLFLAFERRIDADPLVREPRRWAMFGFRIQSN